jgi:hypothetical protein
MPRESLSFADRPMDGWRLHTLFQLPDSDNKVTIQGQVLLVAGLGFFMRVRKTLNGKMVTYDTDVTL